MYETIKQLYADIQTLAAAMPKHGITKKYGGFVQREP